MGWSILGLWGDGAAGEVVLDGGDGDEEAVGEKLVRWGGVEGEEET